MTIKLGSVRRSLAVAAAGCLTFTAAACSSSSKQASGNGSTNTSAATGSGGTTGGSSLAPYTIGFEGSLSGAYAPSTVDLLDTFKTWISYTNAHGGINGHPVKAVYTDDAGSSVTALNNVKSMVGNGIKVIFGPIAFGTALAPIQQQGGFTNYIIAPIDQLYNPKLFPTTYDTYPTNADVINAITTYAKQHNYTKWAIVNDGTEDTEAASLTAQAAAAAGATVVRNDTVNPAAVDFSSEALKIKNSGADAIMMYLIGPDVALFLQAIEAAGISTPILNNSTASASDLTAAPVSLLQNQVFEAVTSTSVLVNGAPSQGYVPYVSLLLQLYGKSAGGSAVGTEFDTYDLMGYTIAKAGGTDPAKIKQVMESITNQSFLSNLVHYTFTPTNHGTYGGTGYNGFLFVHPLPMSKEWPGFFPAPPANGYVDGLVALPRPAPSDPC